ncbi:MAG: hypothetical protein A3G64_02930 [Candidatus Liptonbacteria bacterium RIFCSPLOWO2_12_FULL_60_15]|uniref:PDZ domain-containing protein n=1 Tax=Candidatus Liptonbacteria bacterium RIFCSPLOWO2_12_FULL_60_15 TaxID=1798653 RepID=A0A1G2CNB2_9BACT|nr:MAG: hypothetical protein A3G64_02930 [Candidatus Liptonbacteria bacterium RIFCSPLOWO2_12_FULL_60_15]
MKRKIAVFAAVILIAGAIFGGGFFGGFEYGLTQTRNIVVQGVSNMDEGNPDADFGVFWEAWQTLKDNHIDAKKLADQDFIYGAIKGLVGSFDDPYTEFFNPEDSEKFAEDLNGVFGGVGMEIGIRNDQLLVVAPLKDTPAARAGILAGDMILEIDGESTSGLNVQAAVKKIRGEPGTVVKLQIIRESWSASREFAVTREIITVPTLDMEIKDGNIAYIQLYNFNENANPFFYRAMVRASEEDAEGVVLDLRNNPGGFLEVAVDLAGWFVERGAVVVSEEDARGERKPLQARGNAALLDIPVVVLVNEGSASASEILAGALRDLRGVKLIGEKTFGKGTVQQIIHLADDSTLKITIAHWVLPKGTIIDKNGLEPDIEVKLTEKDIEAKRDPQLDRALAEIKKEIEKARAQL